MAFAAPVILWGADAPSDKLRQCARCTGCGSKGATLKHPSWGGNSLGLLPFPNRPGARSGKVLAALDNSGSSGRSAALVKIDERQELCR
jgi:hypothetical protein